MLVKALIVDDDPEFAGFAKLLFKEPIKEGKLVFVFASNGVEALNLLQADLDIELLITDIRMPYMDGLVLLAKVNELKPNLNPVLTTVVMSAFDDIENIRRAMNAGAFDFLPKPINPADFRATMGKSVEHVRGLKNARQLVRQNRKELNQAYETLEKANEQLRELDKLKSAFISVVTHELRSPFVNISFSTELLMRYCRKQAWSEALAQVAELEDGIQSAWKMVDTLIVFAQFFNNRGELDYTKLDLGAVVEKSLIPCRKQAENKGINLHVNLAEKRLLIQADEARLNDAIYHLVGNAIKFTGEGGHVWVRVYTEPEAIFFEVEDTGCGVEPDRLASLWHSFAQLADPVNRGVEGLGLGLALVNYIIKAHNGDVFATSKLGKGSTFGFHLLYNNLANGEPGTYI
jgi:signal transduction histidine kinase